MNTMPEQSYSFTIAIPPLVTRIAKMLLTHNAKAYLVGGVVRDAVINETYKTNLELRDFDLEIFGLESKNVELLLKDNLPYYVSTEGKSFQVFKIHYQKGFKPIDIAIARSETSTGPSHTDFVVSADPSLSITQAARRRDLTMNALYYDIVKKRIIDPFYGFAHIQNKVIHHVNDDSFPEDPLRVLRVMQFASRFDFDVSDETIAVCKKIVESCSLSTLPPERVLAEFLTFLYESTTPSRGLDFLNKCDALSLFLPEIAHLVAIPQTPSWHPEGNVYKHTLQAANVAAQIASREGLSRFEKALLIMASLCHDLGKAETTRYNAEQDVYTAYTHSKEGEQLSKTLLNRLQLPAFIKDRVPVLTQKHLLLPVLYENHVNGIDQKRAVHRIMKQLAKQSLSIEMLLWLTEADMRARSENTDFTPLSQDNVPLVGELRTWILVLHSSDIQTFSS